MPQSQGAKLVNTFVKGLITERNELTFPPDASVDELNCDLRRDGSRRRRLGVAYEQAYTLSSFTVTPATTVSTGEWLNVGGKNGQEFLVLQVGSTLRFYNKSTVPFSDHEVTETVNLTPYQISGGNVATAKCAFTSINGSLVVVSSDMEPIIVERDNTTGTLTVTQIELRVRDFDWQSDKTAFGSQAVTASADRQYDTQNAGWPTARITTYQSTYANTWPPLTHPWFSGKDSSGNFSVAEWNKIEGGTSIIGNGRFIYNFFNKNRSSNVASAVDEVENSRPVTTASFASRVFYAGFNSGKNSGKILFSQFVETLSDVGECLQSNDPTSEYFSDLLDTDGGIISIPDCTGIKKLHVFGNSLYIFATNGVWVVSGVDNVFSATAYAINKISDIGIVSTDSFVSVDGYPFWWSRFGIHAISVNDLGDPSETNISLNTIQTYWDTIEGSAKEKVRSVYDKINKKIYWFYPSNGETIENKVNNVLVLDTAIQAFYPWRIEDQSTGTNYVIGAVFYSGFGADDIAYNIVSNGDNVQANSEEVIITELVDYATGSPAITLICRDGATGKITMGSFSSSTFLDWGEVNYQSYAEAGYDFMEDGLVFKTAPYLLVYCRRTEDGWAGSEALGYDPTGESSLLVSAYWDFKTTPSSAAQQAYRLKHPLVVDETALGTFTYPNTVISTRLKLRGRGRSTRLKFESEEGKDFILLGYVMVYGKNARY